MKKLIKALTLFAVVSLSSCGIMGTDITSQESIDKYLVKSLNKHIDPEATIYEIKIYPKGNFTKYMDMAVVYFTEPGQTSMKESNITIVGNQEPRVLGTAYDKKKQQLGGQKLADIDFSQIAANIALGKADMEEEDDLTMDGVKEYRLHLNSDPSKVIHRFGLESKIGTKLDMKDGDVGTETSYYLLEYFADHQGNVEFVE